MKNIQIIDGAVNSTFEIYEVSDELHQSIFPDHTDVAFLDDVERAIQTIDDNKAWDEVYRKKVDKKHVVGIHGTLHLTGSPCKKEFFPSYKEKEVLHSLE